MKDKGKLIAQDKVLLNQPGYHGTAASSLNLHEFASLNGKPYIQGELGISDCTRTIELNLNIYNPREYSNSLFKLRQLQRIVNLALQNLEEYQDKYIKKYKKAKKKLKQKSEEDETTEESNQQGETTGENIQDL